MRGRRKRKNEGMENCAFLFTSNICHGSSEQIKEQKKKTSPTTVSVAGRGNKSCISHRRRAVRAVSSRIPYSWVLLQEAAANWQRTASRNFQGPPLSSLCWPSSILSKFSTVESIKHVKVRIGPVPIATVFPRSCRILGTSFSPRYKTLRASGVPRPFSGIACCWIVPRRRSQTRIQAEL